MVKGRARRRFLSDRQLLCVLVVLSLPLYHTQHRLNGANRAPECEEAQTLRRMRSVMNRTGLQIGILLNSSVQGSGVDPSNAPHPAHQSVERRPAGTSLRCARGFRRDHEGPTIIFSKISRTCPASRPTCLGAHGRLPGSYWPNRPEKVDKTVRSQLSNGLGVDGR